MREVNLRSCQRSGLRPVECLFLKLVSTAVFLQLPGAGEALTAAVAAVQFHPGVDLHVRLQLVGLAELTPADLTLVRSLSSVEFGVSVKVVARPESFAALLTGVPFLPGVERQVLLQAARLQEPLPALAAAVGFLLAVAPHVVNKRTFTMERLPTGGADEAVFLCVVFLVNSQSASAGEPFPTRHHLSVQVRHLLMLQEFRVVEKCLPTQVAHEQFLGAMSEHVGLQCPASRELFPALLAPGRFLTCVDSQVPPEIVLETKSDPAHLAEVGFLPRVDDLMLHQRSFQLERLPAVRAPERPLV